LPLVGALAKSRLNARWLEANGITVIWFVPKAESCLLMSCWNPSLIERITTIATTPITMPKIVRIGKGITPAKHSN
jgi:hypothetical protein